MRSSFFPAMACLQFMAMAGTVLASPGTDMRDLIKQQDGPVHEQMWALLEVKPLPKITGNPVLRIWDETSSVTLSTSGNVVTIRVVQGVGELWFSFINSGVDEVSKRPPNARELLKTKATEFTYPDAVFADDIRYLISQHPLFDSTARGADGSTTFFDVRDADGKFSTFEVWSPDERKAPISTEICNIFGLIELLVSAVECTDEDWIKTHQKWNFMARFPQVTGVNLTREKARTYLDETFKRRLQSFVGELRRR